MAESTDAIPVYCPNDAARAVMTDAGLACRRCGWSPPHETELRKLVERYCSRALHLPGLLREAKRLQLVWGAVDVNQLPATFELGRDGDVMAFGTSAAGSVFIIVSEGCVYSPVRLVRFFGYIVTDRPDQRVFATTAALAVLKADGTIEPARPGVLELLDPVPVPVIAPAPPPRSPRPSKPVGDSAPVKPKAQTPEVKVPSPPVTVAPTPAPRRSFGLLGALVLVAVGVGIGIGLYVAGLRPVAPETTQTVPAPVPSPSPPVPGPPSPKPPGPGTKQAGSKSGPVTVPAPPPVPRNRAVLVETDPPGARVTFDDQLQEGVSPLKLVVPVDDKAHTVRVELDGYQSATAELPPDATGAPTKALLTLLPVVPARPPGPPPPPDPPRTEPPAEPPPVQPATPPRLVVRALYPVLLTAGGRLRPAAPTHTVELTPGPQVVLIEAPQVYLRETLKFVARPGETRTEVLPDTVSVTIAAVSGTCRVSVSGSYVGIAPVTIQIAKGRREIELAGSGPTPGRVSAVIDRNGQQVLGTCVNDAVVRTP